MFVSISKREAFTFIEVIIVTGILAVSLTALASSIFSLQGSKTLIDENRKAVEIAQAVVERIQGETWDSIGRSPATWHRRETATAGLQYCDQLLATTTEEFMHRPMTDEPAGLNIYEYIAHGTDPDGDGVYTPSPLDMEDLGLDEWGLPYVQAGQTAWFNGLDPDAVNPVGAALPAEIRAKYNDRDRYNWLQFIGILDRPSGLRGLEVFVEYYRMQAMTGVSTNAEWQVAMNGVNNQIEQSHIIMDLTELDDLDAESVIIRVIVKWNRKDGTDAEHEVLVARRQ